MAKDKEFEKEYKRIGKERLHQRILNRKYKAKEKLRIYGPNHKKAICSHCGGIMTWCSCCEMFSSTCCEDYGTCLCS